MSVSDRIKCIKSHFACFNCLGLNHVLANCPSPLSCRHCSSRHHSSIHRHSVNESREEPLPSTSSTPPPTQAVSLFNRQPETGHVILGTANIFLHDADDVPYPAKALMDAGSTGNLITRELANKLGLKTIPTSLKITGIGNSQTSSHQRVFSKITTRNSRFTQSAEFLILPVITTLLPTYHINVDEWDVLSHINLADPTFNTPSKIDVLLGADLFYKLLDNEKIDGNSKRPTLIKTKLGWIFAGQIPNNTRTRSMHFHMSLTEQLEKFWKIDECLPAEKFTAEEIECENHFVKNHSRAPDGRYIVKLPFSKDPLSLGYSRSQARRRWLSVESRLAKDGSLREDYHQFMKDYINLGHMSCVGPETEVPDIQGNYFLPHHPVIKNQSTSTRLRIVFDGSMKTSNGTSLNNILMVGPTIQSELFEILLRFRRYQFVFVADVQRMYGQVLVDKQDRVHQLIFWRESPTSSLCVYELNTVTYGTSSAPFLATRSLKQLALDERVNFPNAATTVLDDFYVDDVLTGHNTLDGALTTQKELITLLSRGGFPLKKFAANHSALLENIPEEDRETLFSLNVTSEDAMKTLGLTWIPLQDSFLYDASHIAQTPAKTKRQILSQIASLFDPLGLLGPIVCSAKIFMQELWKEKYDWDSPLPTPLTEKWKNFNQSLRALHEIRIPRFVACPSARHYELHGFSDASQAGFGCAIYMRTRNTETTHSVALLCAKSRVAPVKPVTIPRLELSAALLLVRLLITVSRALKLNHIPTHCWSDSKIVLSWLSSSSPHLWKTFVANRVAEIQDYETTWKYVPSEHNPADLISRGTTVSQLKNSPLWWGGPEFLRENDSPLLFETVSIDESEAPEKRKVKNIIIAIANITNDLLSRYSSLHTLVSITAWIQRFIHNTRNPTARRHGTLTLQERDAALSVLVHTSQNELFAAEIHSLNKKGRVSKHSKL